jgi:hypothetical protein
MRAHYDFIQGAQNIDYLSRFNTPYSINFTGGSPNTTLIYQISGTSGTCFTDRDVIVAINFSGGPLKVNVGVNTGSPYHLEQGRYTDGYFRKIKLWLHNR